MFDTLAARPADLEALIAPSGEAGEQFATELPGSELAYLLEQVDLDRADDFAVVEVVAAWQRLASWVAAGAAHAAATLAARPSMNPHWPASAGQVSQRNVAGEELAMRLGCSRRQGVRLVRAGVAFEGPLAWTGQALARGEIDPVKAQILVDGLAGVAVPLALDVQDALLPAAPTRTPTQLARDLARALITFDPVGAAARHDHALSGRRVDRPKVLADGMAGLWAVLPAVGAARLDSALDCLARGARTAGDPRTLDQLRADLLVGLTAGDVAGSAARAGLCPAGTGPADPGPADPGPAGARPAGPEAGDACPFPGTSRRTEIRVSVSLSTLMGLDEMPADLAGYGPITADAARAIARGGTWRRLVTDPLTGRVLDYGRTRYRPPTDLVEHVRARDGTCARPGCAAPAQSCDLDHTIEYHRHGGPTAVDNLGPLCRRDHAIKTDGGYHLAQTESGVFEWTTPTGHHYRVQPGLDDPYQHLPRPDTPPPY